MELVVFALSLIVSFAIERKVAQITVNVVTTFFALIVVLTVENLVGVYIVSLLPIFNPSGLIIGAIVGTLYGIFSEALCLDK